MTTPFPAAEASPSTAAGPAFIEVQFPVSKLSKESYDERKGAQGQALTGLGKWWGRKPLVLVRAILLGLLLPATDDQARDREVFLTLMTMDDEGLWRRVRGSIPARDVFDLATPREREEFFATGGATPTWKRGVSVDERRQMQRRAFLRMNYDRKLAYCATTEEVDGPSPEAWPAINAHLGTNATSLPELVQALALRRFGRPLRVGDAFAGGGNIPFAAARLGCQVYASDLSPVAALLTWGALNIVGGTPEVVAAVNAAQQRVYQRMQAQVEAWGTAKILDQSLLDGAKKLTEAIQNALLIRGYYPGKRFSYSDVMKHLRRRKRHLPTYAQDSRRWTADHQRGMEAAYMELGMTEDQLDLFFPHRSKIYEQEASDG
jgi:hypothetical protein